MYCRTIGPKVSKAQHIPTAVRGHLLVLTRENPSFLVTLCYCAADGIEFHLAFHRNMLPLLLACWNLAKIPKHRLSPLTHTHSTLILLFTILYSNEKKVLSNYKSPSHLHLMTACI